MLDTLERSARSLLDEIVAQRQLTSAEAGELELEMRHVDSVALLGEIAEAMRYHDVGVDRRVEVSPDSERFSFETDPTLIRRAIVNLVKNGLEAIKAGEAVTLGARMAEKGDGVVFEVHNPGVIPRDVLLQLFRRSFSTKGAGRGLGTYSVRLLVEEYLHGSVTVTSTRSTGTVFRLEVPNATPTA
jgi:signal transduction histidine kinase